MVHYEQITSNIGERKMTSNNFTPICLSEWDRYEYFEHYLNQIPCTYSTTVTLDITQIITSNKPLYPTMIYLLSKVVNAYEGFRVGYKDEQLGYYSVIHPSYTIFNQETKKFSSVHLVYKDNFDEVLQQYKENQKKYGECTALFPKEAAFPTFCISMIPWLPFESFQLHLPKGDQYFQPIITMGKYHMKDNRYYLPIAFQVHHSVCDGYHLSQCLMQLQDYINQWK